MSLEFPAWGAGIVNLRVQGPWGGLGVKGMALGADSAKYCILKGPYSQT